MKNNILIDEGAIENEDMEFIERYSKKIHVWYYSLSFISIIFS